MPQAQGSIRLREERISNPEIETEEVSFQGDGSDESNHMTKNGTPDRRYKGQRDLPESEVVNPDYRHATTASVVTEGFHATKAGKPDRRFLENRALSEDEAEVMMAEHILNSKGKDRSQH